jgi:hypothetical protein
MCQPDQLDRYARDPRVPAVGSCARRDGRSADQTPRRWLAGAASGVAAVTSALRDIGEGSAISFRRWP